MGAQTMGSQGGGGGGGNAVQMPKSHSLARQGFLYSLTLDEVQTHLGDLGKPLGSMNLEELLKTLWTAETTEATGVVPDNAVSASAWALHRQGSVTLSRDLSKKTVDEVWRDIQRQKKKYSDQESNKAQERQPTLGEMTLEDFLVKAEVVTVSPNKGNADAILGVDSIASPQHSNITQHCHWIQYQLPSVQQPQQQQQQNMMAVFMPGAHHLAQQPPPVLDAAYPDTHVTMSPSSLTGALSDTSLGRKRAAPGDVVEKTVERRQKRMIKNRESAARSRARKQAYTHELENKVSRLEEENERLRRQKEVEKVLASAPPPEPKYQLRRTSSTPF